MLANKSQEIYNKPCDTGSAIKTLAEQFPTLDFSNIDQIYPDKSSPTARRYFCTPEAILARAQLCLEKLYSRPEKVIIVVAHSSFMRLAVSGTAFANADYRIFDFGSRESNHSAYTLVEWESTKANGGGMGRSPKKQFDIVPENLPRDPLVLTN